MSKKIQRISAYGLLLKNNELLLCRLSQRVMKSAGQWTLPGGGLDFGESPEDAMVREFSEETGLTVKTGALLAVVEGELKFESEGTTDLCEWFTESDAKKQKLVGLAQVGLKHAFA